MTVGGTQGEIAGKGGHLQEILILSIETGFCQSLPSAGITLGPLWNLFVMPVLLLVTWYISTLRTQQTTLLFYEHNRHLDTQPFSKSRAGRETAFYLCAD